MITITANGKTTQAQITDEVSGSTTFITLKTLIFLVSVLDAHTEASTFRLVSSTSSLMSLLAS